MRICWSGRRNVWLKTLHHVRPQILKRKSLHYERQLYWWDFTKWIVSIVDFRQFVVSSMSERDHYFCIGFRGTYTLPLLSLDDSMGSILKARISGACCFKMSIHFLYFHLLRMVSEDEHCQILIYFFKCTVALYFFTFFFLFFWLIH